MTAGVARHRYRNKVWVKLNRSLALQKLFSIHCPGVGAMDDSFTAEVPVKLFVVGDVILMREKHGRHSAQLFNLLHQSFGEARRIYENIAFPANNEIARSTIRIRRGIATEVNIVVDDFR